MSIFNELVIGKLDSAKANPGIPFNYSPKLSRFLNAIQQGKLYTIGGRESGGKRSFVDLEFFLGAYISWFSIPEEQRPPLKILYFNMDKPLEQKFQKWTCTYLWIVYGIFIDINTLQGGMGRLYDMDDEVRSKILEAKGFFDYMMDNDILRIFNGPRNPTAINSEVVGIMSEYGDLTKEKNKPPVFNYYEGYENTITLVIIDNTDKLIGETHEGDYMNTYQLNDTLRRYLVDLKRVYKATPVVIVPTGKVSGVTLKKDMLPDFREFGIYYKDSDVAINCFNPHQYIESTSSWKGYEIPHYTTNPDKIGRLRTIHLMRNQNGVDNLTIAYVMHPENGYFEEAPHPESQGYFNFTENLRMFKSKLINEKNNYYE